MQTRIRRTLLPLLLLPLLATLAACSTRMQANMALPDEPERAVRLYEQALADDPDSARTRIRLGRALIHAGRYAEAEAGLNQALRELPYDPEGRFLLALSALGGGPGAALARLMEYRPPGNEEIGKEVRLAALRASSRDLSPAEVIREMEDAYERGRSRQEAVKPLLHRITED